MNRAALHTTFLAFAAGTLVLLSAQLLAADEPRDEPANEARTDLEELPQAADDAADQDSAVDELPQSDVATANGEAAAAASAEPSPREQAADTPDDAVAGRADHAADEEAVFKTLPQDPESPAAVDVGAAADVAPDEADDSAPADAPPSGEAPTKSVAETVAESIGNSVSDSADGNAANGAAAPAEKPEIAIDTLADGTDQQESDVPLVDVPLVDVPLAEAVAAAEKLEQEIAARSMKLLNGQVPPGTYQRLSWSATELFEALPVSTPVLVVNGKHPGPTLCLTAAVHGDELNGIEMVRRVMHDLDPQKLSGAVIGVPIVNLQGFRRSSRYLPDRRDLNRYFPGNPNGSSASRIAHSFFTEVILNCDALIDLHTGSFERSNLPQLRADLRNPDVVTLTHGFGATVILHSTPANGTLRYAASNAGIATVTLEAGGPSELELKEVMHGVKGIETLLNTLGMVKKMRLWGDPEPVYYRSVWVRADRGGILLADVSLGSTVRRGDLLGTITDPMNNASTNLYAPSSGRVIGMARNQVVMPGFAAFHVGIQTAERQAAENGADESDEALVHDSEESNDDYIDGMSE